MPASVRKAAQVLDLFSVQRPDWGPTEVADELKIAKSTAHALLRELAGVGLTERLPCGRYRLGWRTLGLARTMLATNGHLDMITPTARRLANHFGETVHITAWQRGRVLYVATERPPGGVAAPTEPVVAELTPPGRVLLAERAGDTGNPAEVQRLRRRGYAVGPQRALERVDCAAAPVRTSDGPATIAPGALRPTGPVLGAERRVRPRHLRRQRADREIRAEIATGPAACGRGFAVGARAVRL